MGKFQFQQLSTLKPYHSCNFMAMAFNFLPKSPGLQNPLCFFLFFTIPLTSGLPFECQMNGSDMISQLELDKPEERRIRDKRVNGIFWIILINVGLYVADHVFQKVSLASSMFPDSEKAFITALKNIESGSSPFSFTSEIIERKDLKRFSMVKAAKRVV